jgi:Fur family transcriptional regulator, ferric uptake regulator
VERCVDPKSLGREAYGAGRVSPQRAAIALAVDASSDRAFSAEDLAAAVRRETRDVGLATVYRAVAAMEAAGFIEPVGERAGATLYARCGRTGHHHHLMCTSCGTVADATCPVGVTPDAGDSGFRITGHSLVLYGLCPRCQGAEPKADRGYGPQRCRRQTERQEG